MTPVPPTPPPKARLHPLVAVALAVLVLAAIPAIAYAIFLAAVLLYPGPIDWK